MIALTSSQYRKVARGESIRVKLIGAHPKLIRVKFKPSTWKGFLAYLGWS